MEKKKHSLCGQALRLSLRNQLWSNYFLNKWPLTGGWMNSPGTLGFSRFLSVFRWYQAWSHSCSLPPLSWHQKDVLEEGTVLLFSLSPPPHFSWTSAHLLTACLWYKPNVQNARAIPIAAILIHPLFLSEMRKVSDSPPFLRLEVPRVSIYTQNDLSGRYDMQLCQKQNPLQRIERALFGERDGDMIFKNDFCTQCSSTKNCTLRLLWLAAGRARASRSTLRAAISPLLDIVCSDNWGLQCFGNRAWMSQKLVGKHLSRVL